jgi:ABC-type Zn uptake system ZnuABC Zn-binding protein ZnuA
MFLAFQRLKLTYCRKLIWVCRQKCGNTYHALIAKRRAETLTTEEQATLIEISDQIEQANAHRIEYLIELATVRGTSLEAVMHELGIEAPAYV